MVERTTETCVSIPLYQSLVSGIAAALCLAVGTLGLQWAIGDRVSWLSAAIAGGIAFCAGFALVWCLLLWAMWPRVPEPPPTVQAQTFHAMSEALPLTPITFGAHGAREFVNDALWRVDGKWTDKDGGCSFRAMQRKGWSRDRWSAGVAWLVDHGMLRWRDENEHRLGMEWDFDRVSDFMRVR